MLISRESGLWFSIFLFSTVSIIPLVWICILYTMYLISAVVLGHFPVPSLNDPKSISLLVSTLHLTVSYGLNVLLLSAAVWPFLFFILYKFKMSKPRLVTLFGFGIGLVLIQIFIDPFNVLYWFLD